MDKIEELLTRGVDKIYPSKEELEKVLRSGKKLKLYQGFDPTGTELHIGHVVGLRKLRQWQDLGHHVIFLIGDGTGQAGDPSGKTRAREKFLTREELRKNAVDYVKQAGKIVRFEGKNPVEILYNGDWLNKLKLIDLLNIANQFSLQQLSERDLFQERIKEGQDINFREFLYPLLQAYDSVAMKVDLEIGGSDQTFNMLCGRTLVKKMLKKDKFVMTTPLLTDSQGVKIGKTEGNVIALNDNPNDLFGKIMALGDDIIIKGLEYLTDLSTKDLDVSANPMKYKKQLAFEIVKQLNNDQAAKKAQEQFETIVQGKEMPSEIRRLTFTKTFMSNATITDALEKSGMVSSKSEAKRVVGQGGTAVYDSKITDPNALIAPLMKNEEIIIRVGKRNIVKIGTES
ncbi:MAG: tyrosine--tRNA ligase [Candidatus Levybacteria bacterium RIFCSPHIGHO2_02_FULL_37_13]|nr:MAG: tyrosine--tRNA ligase [Candidatus Levybacteria bacterium RIFCSPHIGHO2_02_FULL_37_13]OGH29456.1 MAG: tyrosine--tRNA ligase [Candidatus Levybacteria bacterium RIFCSPHIGHO2_12_FULL_37_9]OGH40362.1 MAG: tyrosine--tRNA ligase [Candidatus Levybacteria bacterium RIFCSPLOWO2_01_FULL_37_26]